MTVNRWNVGSELARQAARELDKMAQVRAIPDFIAEAPGAWAWCRAGKK